MPETSLVKSGDSPLQAEANTRQAEIVHPDGTRESVLLNSERYWSGALPRPEDFAKYAEVVSDAPERILAMAEAEQQHRISVEGQIIKANAKSGSRGQWLGAAISALAMGLAVLSFVYGAHISLSLALLGVPVMSVARSLVQTLRSE